MTAFDKLTKFFGYCIWFAGVVFAPGILMTILAALFPAAAWVVVFMKLLEVNGFIGG